MNRFGGGVIGVGDWLIKVRDTVQEFMASDFLEVLEVEQVNCTDLERSPQILDLS